MKYKLVFFDLDGTLIDPKKGICKAINYASEKMGLKIRNSDEYHLFIGPPLGIVAREYFNLTPSETGVFIEHYRYFYMSYGINMNSMYDGIVELIKSLAKYLEIGIVTSKPTVFANKILRTHGIRKYFNFVCGSSLSHSSESKAGILEEAISRQELNNSLNRNELLMVGDRKFDVLAAKENGIDSVFVTYGYGNREEGIESQATYMIDSVQSLKEFFISN